MPEKGFYGYLWVTLRILHLPLPLWIFMDIHMGMSIRIDSLAISPEILSLISEIDEF